MMIVRKGLLEVAIIDPEKKVGEDGQRLIFRSGNPELEKVVITAKIKGREIRYYYKDLTTMNGEVLPCKIVVTEIPGGHVQPFHSHEKIHECSIVNEGSIIVIDDDGLLEDDKDRIRQKGIVLNAGDMVIEDPNIRHTIMNHTDVYARFTTTQVARGMLFEKFEGDWKR